MPPQTALKQQQAHTGPTDMKAKELKPSEPKRSAVKRHTPASIQPVLVTMPHLRHHSQPTRKPRCRLLPMHHIRSNNSKRSRQRVQQSHPVQFPELQHQRQQNHPNCSSQAQAGIRGSSQTLRHSCGSVLSRLVCSFPYGTSCSHHSVCQAYSASDATGASKDVFFTYHWQELG
eukprot:4743857-Amphidinium_carterae.3